MIAEIVVGTAQLRLPKSWRWQDNKNGSWSAVNITFEVTVSADLRGDDGLQVVVEAQTQTYVPAIVIALVVLANDGGTINHVFQKMSSYVTRLAEVEEIQDAD